MLTFCVDLVHPLQLHDIEDNAMNASLFQQRNARFLNTQTTDEKRVHKLYKIMMASPDDTSNNNCREFSKKQKKYSKKERVKCENSGCETFFRAL